MKLHKRILAMAAASCLALSLTACGGNNDTPSGSEGADLPPIQIATKPMTEQYILGEMLKQVIEDKTGYTCEVTEGIAGGTNNIMPAMESGEFDLYPEYTSSGYVMVLGHDAVGVDDEAMWEQLLQEYHDNYQMTWIGQYGFNNTFCLVVRGDVAEEYGLVTSSDLTAVSDQLVFGGNPDYIERADGYNMLCDTYGLPFQGHRGHRHRREIRRPGQRRHRRDQRLHHRRPAQRPGRGGAGRRQAPAGQLFCSTVVREDTLEEYPGLEDALMLMDGLLTDEDMSRLNYLVEVEGQDEADVAHDFLVEKGILDA